MTLAVEAEGTEITTVEGLLDGEELGTVQKAFVEAGRVSVRLLHPGPGHGRRRSSPDQPLPFLR